MALILIVNSQFVLCTILYVFVRLIISPAINEEPFGVLYWSNASRPNTPVNVCIGALILKESFGNSGDEVAENLMLDPRYQYKFHTTSCDEQPLNDKRI